MLYHSHELLMRGGKGEDSGQGNILPYNKRAVYYH